MFLENILLSEGRMRKTQNVFEIDPKVASISGPIILRNMLGPDIDATVDQILTQLFGRVLVIILFVEYCRNHYRIEFLAKIAFQSQPRKELGILVVNAPVPTKKTFCCFFVLILFLCVFALSVFFWTCFVLGMKNIPKTTRRNQTTRSKQANGLVVRFAKDNAHIKHSRFIKNKQTTK